MTTEPNQEQSFKNKDFKFLPCESLVYIADVYDMGTSFQEAFVNDDYCATAGARQYIKEHIHLKLDAKDEEVS